MNVFLKRILGIAAALALVGQGCTKAPSQAALAASKPVTLNVWGVVDDFNVYESSFNAFRKSHPNVSFNFRRFRLEEYEKSVVDALAEDRGPDIFMIHNTWTNKYLTKISPMPATTKVAYKVQQGKNTTWVLKEEASITNRTFKNEYADVAQADVLRTVDVAAAGADRRDLQERIMGMPVGIDTLALYYNKDRLNAAAIPTPPQNWTEFTEQAKKLTKLDAKGEIVQSAAGIGTANNVERATDILTALMIQNGTEMAGADRYPTFDKMPATLSATKDASPPSWQAIQFYTDFANPGKDTFTWDSNQPNSLDAFIQGKTAFFFGYAFHYDIIRSRAPKLNLGLTALPQIENFPVKNVANYWFFVVSKKTKGQDAAWNYLNQLTKPEYAKEILTRANRPAAKKSLLPEQLESERIGVFASQVLTARSWYKGRDPERMEAALSELITSVLQGTPVQKAVRFAAEKVSQTISGN